MASSYTPTDFFKDGRKKTAKTWMEHWQYIYDGWTIGGPTPAPPRSSITAHLADIDHAVDPINASIAGILESGGTAGKSAYEVAVAGGYAGTQAQWLTSLVGPKGDAGKSAYEVAVAGGYAGTQAQWLTSLTGPNGASAYQVAVANGFAGTQAQWLASLTGPAGPSGAGPRPSWASTTKPFDSDTGLYNGEGSTLAKTRAALAKAAAGTAQCFISVLGDSQSQDAFSAAGGANQSWPYRLSQMLSARVGSAGTGIMIPLPQQVTAQFVGLDSRWAYVGAVSSPNNFGVFGPSGGQGGCAMVNSTDGTSYIQVSPGMDYDYMVVYALTTNNPLLITKGAGDGTAATRWWMDPLPGNVSPTAAPANYTKVNTLTGYVRSATPATEGGLRVGIVTPAVRDKADTFRLYGTSQYIVGVEFRKNATAGVVVNNLSVAGQTVTPGLTGNTTGDISGDRGLALGVDAPNADLLIIAMSGTNEWAGKTTSVATYKAALKTVVQRQLASGATGRDGFGVAANGDVLLVAMPQMDYAWYNANLGVTNVSPRQYIDYLTACYQVADELNVALLDLAYLWVDYATANGAGIIRDWVHPNAPGAVAYATAVVEALEAPGPLSASSGPAGRGIVSITRTNGDGSAGTVDTYTITYTDATTSTYSVRNGADGVGGSGSSSPFVKVIDEAGASVANFTAVAGTWGTDGAVITQTDASAAYKQYRVNTKIAPGIPLVYEADVQIVSGGTIARAGLLIGWAGATSAGAPAAYLQLNGSTNGSPVANIDIDQTGNKMTAAVAGLTLGTWKKLRVGYSGGVLSVWVDGTLIGSAYVGAMAGDVSYVGLYSYGGSVKFRNLKAWSMTLAGLPA